MFGDMKVSTRLGLSFGVVLVLPKQLQPGLQQGLELRISGVWNEGFAQGSVDGLVIGNLVLDIGAIECRAVKAQPAGQK